MNPKDKLNKLWADMLSEYPTGVSNTSTSKYNSIRNYLSSLLDVTSSEIYATGAKTRTSNLDTRFVQGNQAGRHTKVGVAFMQAEEGVRDIEQLSDSAVNTSKKFVDGSDKSQYDTILIFVEHRSELLLTRVIQREGCNYFEKLVSSFPEAKLITTSFIPDKRNGIEVSQNDPPKYQLSVDISFGGQYRALFMAIKTKPFILLAGISGTGKSRVARSLAYLTCSEPALQNASRPGNFQLVTVKPNWHDPTELMGYISRITGVTEYVPKDFLHFLVRAWKSPHVPFFLCLDEMNLAPVEQYFADYLSVVETRRRNQDGHVISDALLKAEASVPTSIFEGLLINLGVERDSALWARFMDEGISLPVNLVVIGTVNMDETTHSFSRKVLDRAMTFEMNEVDLRSGLEREERAWAYPTEPLSGELVLGRLTRGGDVPTTTEGYNEVLERLETINKVLEGTPFKVAYRVRDEFLIYVYHNSQLKDRPADWLAGCLDELVVMKVLSRIEGDGGKVGRVITGLIDELPKEWNRSQQKLAEMKARLEVSGYTSFWS